MKKNNNLFDYTLIFISIISIGYFILVILNSRFITAYLAYPSISFICIFYGCYELKNNINLLSKLPLKLDHFIKIIFVIIISLFITTEGLIIHERFNNHLKDSDYVIVLGSRLNGNTPSQLLKYRLDAAFTYHQSFPNAMIIVSGGQGNGEDISEAKAMKEYLIEKGINEDLIIEEDKSTNTNENIIYSKRIIDSLTKNDYKVMIITNGFHCYRTKLLANKHNLTAYTYSAKENMDIALHYYIREFFGCLKDVLIS